MPQPPSAGILLFRARDGEVEVLLIRPGGPFWRNKDAGAWMIPKGAIESGEMPVDAAIREFEEEIGIPPDGHPVSACAAIRQSGGKTVEVFAAEGDVDPTAIASIHFEMRVAAEERTAAELPRSRGSALDEIDGSAADDAAKPATDPRCSGAKI